MKRRNYSKWKNVLTDREIELLPTAKMRLAARIDRDDEIDSRIWAYQFVGGCMLLGAIIYIIIEIIWKI